MRLLPSLPTTRRAIAVLATGLAVAGLSACGGDDKKSDQAGSAKITAAPKAGAVYASDQSVGITAKAPEADFGKIVSDSGFDPAKDGFSFENYGPHPGTDLTSVEMQRLFGPDVCTAKPAGSGQPCTLIPTAQQAMNQLNEGMSGGHCYGFSQLALRFFQKLQNPLDFGAAQAFSLPFIGNDKLSRELAYGWATQVTDGVQRAARQLTPTDAVAFLEKAFKAKKDLPTIGIFLPSGQGGHAITPIAIDRDGSKAQIVVYDNNWPGQRRAIAIDTQANTWRYEAAQNPDVPNSIYSGQGRQNPLTLIPSTAGFDVQPCPFCSQSPDGGGGGGDDIEIPDLGVVVSLSGSRERIGHLSISTPDGKRVGYVDGKPVNEVEGARVIRPYLNKVWEADSEPIYLLPSGTQYEVSVDGDGTSADDASKVTVTGPGYSATASGLKAGEDGDTSLMVSSDGREVMLKSTGEEGTTQQPKLQVATAERGDDAKVVVQPAAPLGTAGLAVKIDDKTDEVAIGGDGVKLPKLAVAVTRVGENGSRTFKSAPVSPGDGSLQFRYRSLTKQGEPLKGSRSSEPAERFG